ncbi:MAG: 4a-hydroxytetrahydrobiopterin dehydratase [Hamadaea sp.]|uniref:VOC family protein n=1 Tax=Hamadaea sp. TaxID=2024425 RepID=UPI0017CA9B74|nr:VOC family protein [Hamadaea sp.]NUR71153.1 4a-hydroxytetrahydrobiopterin dehydratase [Hamadaea sp.]NUT23610.1 4a-hydroxytetrahydrobiopterin dehydratase [Hamadaea sp.]
MEKLSRQAASDAVHGLGWRYQLRTLRASIPADSLAEAVALAQQAVDAAGTAADQHLWLDVRRDQVLLALQTQAEQWVTEDDVQLARRISAAVGGRTRPGVRQVLEIAIDALDIDAVRPFWQALLAYAVEEDGSLSDPDRQTPPVWFQQMDAPRPQRNRVHFDVCVPHDEAANRMAAAIAAGGRLVYDAEAPAFWVLADPEGNEACVTTWQARD